MDMPETESAATPKLDLDQLMEQIRAEVTERKQSSGEPAASGLADAPVAAPDFAVRRFNAREILAMPVPEFVRASHLALLGREPEPDEFVRLRDRLLVNRVGRMRVLREFRRSREGLATRRHVEGLWRAFAWDRVYWSPLAKFGRFVGRLIGALLRVPRRIREFIVRLEVLERRAAEAAAAIRTMQSARATDRQDVGVKTRRLQDDLARLERNIAARTDAIEHDTAQRAGAILQRADAIVQRADAIERRADAIERRGDAIEYNVALHAQTLEEAASQNETTLSEMRRKLVDHWRSIVDQKLRMEAFLEVQETAPPRRAEQTERPLFAGEESHLLDAFYLSFEDRYRGTRTDIMERQSVYLERIGACVAATDGGPVIDLGCGRGEWLELLEEAGIPAQGYDLNRIAVEECRERGLNASLADALETLAAMPDNTCSAITGFHIIEHVAFESFVTLLDHSLRVLRPGGLLVLETPNPANLVVAAERFYFDPTHRNPLPSELTAYLLRSRGFDEIEVLPLHPVAWPSWRQYDDPMLAYVQEKLFGPQDYGLMGRKPA